MKFLTKSMIAGLVLTAGTAFAASDTVEMWETTMTQQGGAVKTLSEMAKGAAPYDAAAAEAAKATLIETSAKIPTIFATPVDDPESEAKPEIWTNWDDFVVKATALQTAAAAIDVSSAETIQAGLGAVGASCGGCHELYRVKK